MATIQFYAKPEDRVTMSALTFCHYAQPEVMLQAHDCNGNGCRIAAGAPCFRLQCEGLVYTICFDCVQRMAVEWHLEWLRREKGRVEQQEHPSQARIAELDQEIESAIARVSR